MNCKEKTKKQTIILSIWLIIISKYWYIYFWNFNWSI